jgi:hypothetical protein
MLVISILLAALVLAMILMLPSLTWVNGEVPAIFKITSISHIDDKTGVLNYDSYMVLVNAGTSGYRNRNLSAKTYVNGIQVDRRITTLNADAFCHSVHTGIERIGGLGSRGSMLDANAQWYPGQHLWIDYSRGTFHPGDTVKFEVYDTTTKLIISCHEYHA